MPKEVANLNTPAPSPSGKYLLAVVSANDGQSQYYNFQILTQGQKIVYASRDRFEARFKTYFLWDQNDRVWVYSSDIGTLFWERKQDTDEWEKHSSFQSGIPEPEFLRKVKPN